MTPDLPTVTVVICAHTLDRLDDLRAAVASVNGQRCRPEELLVVIDHNDELLARAADLDAAVMANTGPKGLSGARNTGTAAATGDVIAYLDDDAVADERWLERLIDPFTDSAVAVVGGWADPVWDAGPPGWFPAEFSWVIGCSHRGLPRRRSEVRNVIGCNMAFRASVIDRVGGFEVGLGRTADRPLGCEETELCIRIRQHDPSAVILLEPDARVRHRVPPARGTWRYYLRRCRAEGNSKAHVATLVGSNDGLSSERDYVRSVLPRAVGRALVDLPRAPVDNGGRVAAIIGGLAATSGGYLEHALRARIRR
ncbi:MAG: glycosyltransferase family 2 protein [Acidimicrobiales bacterium]